MTELTCAECGAKFSNRDAYRAHVNKVHLDNPGPAGDPKTDRPPTNDYDPNAPLGPDNMPPDPAYPPPPPPPPPPPRSR